MIKLIQKYKKIIIIILILIILFISIFYFYKNINEQFYNTNINQWGQLGLTINGEASKDRSGSSVSLSSDGQIVAIGSPNNGLVINNLVNAGQVRIFKLDTSQNPPGWVQLGQNINGEALNYRSGYSVSLSSDGQIVAIGSPKIDNSSGQVRIFKLNTSKNPAEWIQLGQTINGEMDDDYSGTSVSLSSDGQIVAIGTPNINSISGQVRIFKLDTSQNTPVWQQFGQTIKGEMDNDRSGRSISLSSNGQIVAIGSHYNSNDNGDYSGHVRIFKLDTSLNPPVWQQFGQTINGEMDDDYSGSSVSLSSDGQIVAIGSPENSNDNGDYSGHVRIFKLDTTQSQPVWQQFGQTINGEMDDDYSGSSVSLSSNGQIVAIGSPDNNDNGDYSGHVRLFKLDTSLNPPVWQQFGQTINGEASDDYSGSSVSLSSDGQIVVIGSYYSSNVNGANSGQVRIFKYNSEEPTTTMPITTTTMPSTTTTMPSTTTTMPSTTTTMPSTTTTMPSTTTTMPSTTTTMPSTTTTMPSTTTTMPSTTTTMPSTTSTMGIMPSTTSTMGIMPTMQEPLNYNYDDYNIGMMLKGSNNTGNLNDFLAKNTLLGNNLYISPMNQTGIVGDDYDSNIVKNNKNIDSTFTPMIKLG